MNIIVYFSIILSYCRDKNIARKRREYVRFNDGLQATDFFGNLHFNVQTNCIIIQSCGKNICYLT